MLLANCVRRIKNPEIPKYLKKSISSSVRRHAAIARHSINSSSLGSQLLPNLTSTTLFTNTHQSTGNHWCSSRFYSNDSNEKSKKGNANVDDDDDLENWTRKLPPFGDDYINKPTIYLWLKNTLSTLLIRSYFDPHFSREEFLSGAKQAVLVVSNLLAQGNFEALQDMVDDDTIAKMRHIVGSMTPEQRKHITVIEEDIQWTFVHEIQFITKENSVENKSRFFVEIMVVVHALREGEIELSDIVGDQNIEFMDKNNYRVANYRFIKEFTNGVDDDWTINHILHVRPSDEMKQQAKLQKEL